LKKQLFLDMDIYAFTDAALLQDIGKKVRQFRLAKNMTQKDLAKFSGVSLSSVASLERGDSVSLMTFVRLVRAVDGLHLFQPFFEKPEISPIAYAKILDAQQKRKRASKSTDTSPQTQTESEW
jgi:transcriptional regulator with XRE-family HTH domain